jgi:predicted XRE-type DNA-binding protein
MKKTNKTRLESAGWKVGSASDFLELTPEEEAFIALKFALARSLKKRRQRKRLTQIELAKLLKSSQSRVAKMEAGDPSVSIDLLVKSLLVLGASPKDLAQIISGLSVSTAV